MCETKHITRLDNLSRISLCAYKRDKLREKSVRLQSRVELHLKNTLGTPSMFGWLPGTMYGGDLVCLNGTLLVRTDTPLSKWDTMPTCSPLPLERQPCCEPTIVKPCFIPPFGLLMDVLANGTPELHTPFPLLRLYSLLQPVPVSRMEELQRWDHPGVAAGSRLLLYDDIAANYLAGKFGISDRLVDEKRYEGPWQRCHIDMSATYDVNAELIPCVNTSGVLSFNLELLRTGDKAILVPTSFFRHPSYPTPLRLYIPPQPPFCLYNADKIAQNLGATIVFTDELATAASNVCGDDFVFSGFYGGDEAIPHLDLTPLAGRHVVWLLMDSDGSNQPKAKYSTAIKIAKQLSEHGVELTFAEVTDLDWVPNPSSPHILLGQHKGVKIMEQDELVKEAARHGVHVPEELHVVEVKSIEGDALEKMEPAPMLVDPILREGTGGVVYGATGVAKSWVAMSLGVAAANGVSVFPDRWHMMNPEGVKCLTIAGEMSAGEYGKRLKRLHPIYAKDDSHKKNFILHLADQLDIASPKGFDQLHEIIDDAKRHRGVKGQDVKLVILDNLTTLSREGENPANFGRIEFALKSLKAEGISVVVIHHENAKGDIRGARKISDVMDMKIQLFKTDEGDKIGVIVKNRKIRSGKQSEFATFKAVLDVDVADAGWVVSELSDEELAIVGELDEDEMADREDSADEEPKAPRAKPKKTKYGLKAWKWMSDEERRDSVMGQCQQGLTSEQISVNHGTCPSTISTFRLKNFIRECDLKNTNLPTP